MSLRKLTGSFIIATLLTINSKAQQSPAVISLKQAIETALTGNINLRQNDLLQQTATANYRQAKNNRLPVLSGEINYGINNGRSIDPFTNSYINQQLSSSNVNLTSSIPIFKGFQANNNIKQTEFTAKAANQEYKQAQDNLVLDVILAYLQVINNEDNLALVNRTASVTAKQVERQQVLANEGTIAPSVLSDLKGQYASDQSVIVSATNALERSKLNLTQLMNILYSSNINLERDGLDLSLTLYPFTSEQIYKTALDKLSLVKAAEFRKRAAAFGIKVARADYYPTLSIFGQFYTNYSSAAQTLQPTTTVDVPTNDYVVVNGANVPVITKQTSYKHQNIRYTDQLTNNFSSFVGINLKIPVFNAFQTRTNVKLARIQEKNANLVEEKTKVQLRQSVEEAHLNMTAAYRRYALLVEQVEAYKESFRTAEIKFNEGVSNSVDYLIAKTNLDRAELNLSNSRYEYLLRTKVLDFYRGELSR